MLLLTFLVLQMLCLIFSASADRVKRCKSWLTRDDEAALKFLVVNNRMSAEMANKMAISSWKYQSNLTKANMQEMLKMLQVQAQFTKETWKNATSFAWKDFKESYPAVYRWFKKLSVLGTAALSEEKLKELNKISADMQDIYGKAKVCRPNVTDSAKCDLAIEPELIEIFRDSRDYELLKHVWAEWRNVTGKQMKDKFLRYVELSNEAAVLNGFSDAGEMWREAYESDTFQDEIEDLWKTIEPFYKQLHAYVRRKLIQQYPGANIKPDGPFPAHLLGNMWAQHWDNIFDVVKPYPEHKFVDVTDVMLEKKMTPFDMFKMSKDFFMSLGLIDMTPEFWRRSIFEKPTDREMVCHASAWDFHDQKDFRIKMCTRVNMEDLITIHHEMGHIEYFQQYSKQPVIFQEGANPGFHEAVGDALALSVATPTHLKKIDLMKDVFDDNKAEINSLLSMALNKIAFIPFGYLIDAWRWKVFSGNISTDELNSKWWDLRLKYQGLCPPVGRTDEDLDAAAKYHVAADIPYIRYFVSYVIQFQFHKALCDVAGHKGPLHKCDIYENKKAGSLLSSMLRLGSSVHWKKAMSVITEGKTDKMDAGPLMEYFRPLTEWLEVQNKKEIIGWNSENPMMCP